MSNRLPSAESKTAGAAGSAAEGRERELRALIAPVAEELEASSAAFNVELDCSSEAVRDVSAHVRRYRGKRLRAAVVLLTGRTFGPPTPSHIKIAAIVEMIHMATLAHDDVLDRADVRRRVPTVNARFGNEIAVLLGDWIYARAFAMSTRLENQTCSRVLSEITATVCRGEIEQTRAKYDFQLSQDRYIEIIDAKTASLYAASAELGALYAGAPESVVSRARDFGRSLGLAFQVIDDCLDFDGAEEVVGKSLGTDIEEGKITLPIIKMMERVDAAGRDRVRAVFEDARDAMLQNGAAGSASTRQSYAAALLAPELQLKEALEASYAVARGHVHDALEAARALPAGPARDCLTSMAAYVLARRW